MRTLQRKRFNSSGLRVFFTFQMACATSRGPPQTQIHTGWESDRSTTLMIASVLIFIPVSFYFGFTASFMADIGIDPDIIPNRISMGQMAEILFILILPFFITRFGVKRVLFIGITA